MSAPACPRRGPLQSRDNQQDECRRCVFSLSSVCRVLLVSSLSLLSSHLVCQALQRPVPALPCLPSHDALKKHASLQPDSSSPAAAQATAHCALTSLIPRVSFSSPLLSRRSAASRPAPQGPVRDNVPPGIAPCTPRGAAGLASHSGRSSSPPPAPQRPRASLASLSAPLHASPPAAEFRAKRRPRWPTARAVHGMREERTAVAHRSDSSRVSKSAARRAKFQPRFSEDPAPPLHSPATARRSL